MAQYESGVTACLDPDVLDAWAGGSLAAAERAKAMTHIAECAACRRAISALAQLDPTQDGPTQDGVARRAPAREGLVGSRLGRYEILRVLGRGGMGIVVAAKDPSLGREVAIKILLPSSDDAQVAAREVRLAREARVLGQLRHRNIVPVYDAGRADDRLYLVMELIDGESLRGWLETPRPATQVLRACLEAARGLAALHAAGFVHRDIKPDNVLVARDGRVLVADLGLAVGTDVAVTRLTRTGVALGTPKYMAPEQLLGDEPDARADQYAFAVMTREALGDRASARIATVLARAAAPDPRARWRSMEALIDALEGPVRPTRPGAWRIAGLVGVAGVAVAGAVVIASWSRAEPPTVALAPMPQAITIAAPAVPAPPPLVPAITHIVASVPPAVTSTPPAVTSAPPPTARRRELPAALPPLAARPGLASHDPPLRHLQTIGDAMRGPGTWNLPPGTQVLLSGTVRGELEPGRHDMGDWILEVAPATRGASLLGSTPRWIVASFERFAESDGVTYPRPVLKALEIHASLF